MAPESGPGEVDFGPRPGESYVAFHARLFEKAEQLMVRRPERQATERINKLFFEPWMFGTVPGADAVATRTAGWTEQTQTQFGRVGAEVADLEVACRTAKERSIDAREETSAVAARASVA